MGGPAPCQAKNAIYQCTAELAECQSSPQRIILASLAHPVCPRGCLLGIVEAERAEREQRAVSLQPVASGAAMEVTTSSKPSLEWQGFIWHRQTKEPATEKSCLNHRATS